MEGKTDKIKKKIKEQKKRLQDKEKLLDKELRLCSAYRSFYLNEIGKKMKRDSLFDKLVCIKCLDNDHEILKNGACLHHDTKEVTRFCYRHDNPSISHNGYVEYFCSYDCPEYIKKKVKENKTDYITKREYNFRSPDYNSYWD